MNVLGYDMNDEAEMRKVIENGRKYRIASDVLKEFLYNRREEIIRGFEDGCYGNDREISDKLAELRVMKKYQDISQMMQDMGDCVERDLQEKWHTRNQ